MIPHLLKKRTSKTGAAPGTLVHIGEKKVDQVFFDVIRYNTDTLEEFHIESVEEAITLCRREKNTWLNINGLHDTDIILRVGNHFQIHPLTLEDILQTAQRPKMESFNSYLYIVLSMLSYHEDAGRVRTEQVSLLLTRDALISFQESKGDVFEPVRQRLRQHRGRIRKTGCDYLAYALLDAVVDHYFIALERIGTDIERIEEAILETPEPGVLENLYSLKREIVHLRKHVWPLRELVNSMTHQDLEFIRNDTLLFLRDVHDHAVQVIETIESFRDLLTSLLDLYLSMNSNRMNEVMKVLTIIATIFIPISFIAGVYGMNFKNMPELNWPFGYALAWSLMAAVAFGLILFFKHKKWF
jgi:magnesium transporter